MWRKNSDDKFVINICLHRDGRPRQIASKMRWAQLYYVPIARRVYSKNGENKGERSWELQAAQRYYRRIAECAGLEYLQNS